MGVDVGQASLDFGDAVRVGGGIGLGEESGALGVGGEHRLDQAAVVGRGLLGDAANAGAGGQGDLAAVRRPLATQKLEKRCLAAAVATDDANSRTGWNLRGRPLEQGLSGDREGQVADCQHGLAGSRARIFRPVPGQPTPGFSWIPAVLFS